MFALLSPRLWLGLALVAMLTFTHGMAYKSGRSAVRVQWDKERAEMTAAALVASEAARAKEQVLTTANAKVTNDYLVQKKLRASDAITNAGKLRDLQAALVSPSGADTAAPDRADDPRDGIIDQCATALVRLDEYAKGVASQATGLQGYAAEVCVSQ